MSAASSLARYFEQASKPAGAWAVGPELELFGFTRERLARIAPDEVQAVIGGFSTETIERQVEDGFITEATISLSVSNDAGRDGANGRHGVPPTRYPLMRPAGRITLEPGGQLEFSGERHISLDYLERQLSGYVNRLREIVERHGIIFIAAGFDPLRGIEEQRWIPKRRYEIMRPYLEARGRRALDMMARTAAVQVNLDYADLDDLARKYSLATRLGPVAAAIFANSPFDRGRLSGYATTRYAAWLETDPDRTGPSPAALDDRFSIDSFLDHVRKVPMFFIRRDGDYIDRAGESFDGLIESGDGIFQDFTDHLSTIFTEARLKPHIEQRSMDCGSLEMVMAALAFWKGLMYDRDALESASKLAPALSLDDYVALQREVARFGLRAKLGQVSVLNLATRAIELARAGLAAQAVDETRYLDVLFDQVIRDGVSPSDILVRNFQGSWQGDIRKAVEYLRIA